MTRDAFAELPGYRELLGEAVGRVDTETVDILDDEAPLVVSLEPNSPSSRSTPLGEGRTRIAAYTSRKRPSPTRSSNLIPHPGPFLALAGRTGSRYSGRRGSNGATVGGPTATSLKAGCAGLRSTFHSLGTTTLGTRSASERSSSSHASPTACETAV